MTSSVHAGLAFSFKEQQRCECSNAKLCKEVNITYESGLAAEKKIHLMQTM